jgi:hypothetical protein
MWVSLISPLSSRSRDRRAEIQGITREIIHKLIAKKSFRISNLRKNFLARQPICDCVQNVHRSRKNTLLRLRELHVWLRINHGLRSHVLIHKKGYGRRAQESCQEFRFRSKRCDGYVSDRWSMRRLLIGNLRTRLPSCLTVWILFCAFWTKVWTCHKAVRPPGEFA